MKISRAETAKIKWEMLEIWLLDPEISDLEMAKRFRIDPHTAAKYKREWFNILNRYKALFEKKIEEKVMEKAGIWQRIRQLIQ